ncbi:prepilin-type N-terminal cleavage/methylation domain-containing protein [Candidatus Berkelbacteria bacterium]|nr:prepilin-type N-terminal cleavage/methylation domain-containing protein [Candidatus Berkelbacteria bacterium]
MNRQQGFSLIEIVLTIALIGLIAGISIPVYRELQQRNDLNVGVNTIVHDLRRAQLLAQSVQGDQNGNADSGKWGVHIGSDTITLFKGASFGQRDTSFDEASSVPVSVKSTCGTDIVFEKFSGLPLSSGTITVTSHNNETHAITISPKGTIKY